MKKCASEVKTVSEAENALPALEELEEVQSAAVRQLDLGTGIVSCELLLPEGLFYEVLSGETGFPLDSDAGLLELLRQLAQIKREYDRVSGALEQVRATGYGIVMVEVPPLMFRVCGEMGKLILCKRPLDVNAGRGCGGKTALSRRTI